MKSKQLYKYTYFTHSLQVGILDNVYEYWLPEERGGIRLNEPYHQITELLQQEYYVST